MERTCKKYFSVAIAAVALCATARAEVLYNSQNRPTEIRGLEIGDARYDASIQYGVSFESLYGDFQAPSPLPTFWNDDPGSLAAVESVATALNLTGILPDEGTLLIVPVSSGTWTFGDYIDGVAAEFQLGGTEYSHSGPFEGIRLDPHVADNFGWLAFRAVPEPSTALALVSAMFALALSRARGPARRKPR